MAHYKWKKYGILPPDPLPDIMNDMLLGRAGSGKSVVVLTNLFNLYEDA